MIFSMDKLLKVSQAARFLGIKPDTLRKWERAGKIRCERVGERSDRRFYLADLEGLSKIHDSRTIAHPEISREALYLRVSGRGDQISSLANQEKELRASTKGTIVAVYKDIGSGLSETRPGLLRALTAAQTGKYDILRVTYRDRLARFGTAWLEIALAGAHVNLEILHEQEDQNAQSELMGDFMSLLASFSGRYYGQRSGQARQRLLAEVQAKL